MNCTEILMTLSSMFNVPLNNNGQAWDIFTVNTGVSVNS